MTDPREDAIRREIFARVEELFRIRHADRGFVPGETPIPYAGRVFDAREIVALVDAALDFWLTLGRYGRRFEEALLETVGAKHVLLTNSGSSANLLAMAALTSPLLEERRLLPGDEVITAAASFPTTVNPLIQNGLVPVFLDVRLGTYNVEAPDVQAALSPRTRAIILAHTLGNPFEVDRVLEIARAHDLFLVEDCCDALGGSYAGRMLGTFGDLATVSFYPAHQITTGEGGAVFTKSGLLKRIAESFRDWGRDCWCEPGKANTCGKRFGWQLGKLPAGYDHKYIYSHIGYNLKPLDLQAAIGVEQLRKLPTFVAARRRNFRSLLEGLRPYEHFFVLPEAHPKAEPSWFGFPLTVRPNAPFDRAAVVLHLETAGIATRMLFAGNIIRQPAYTGLRCRVPRPLTVSDEIMERTFWVGVYPGIDSLRMDYILEQFRRFLARY